MKERDLIRVATIALIVFAILFSLSLYSVFGPVHGTDGPELDTHTEVVMP